jgi:hypothetical protein
MAFKRGKDKAIDTGEIVIDAEIAELPADTGDAARNALPATRRALPEATELRALEVRKESDVAVRNVAVATAGGVVAGAATVVIARAAQKLAKPAPGLARRRRKDVIASRSFMVDVHMLKQR